MALQKKTYNFLDSKLLPKISCKTPSTENYEIENLISDNYAKRIRGFIAYPAIKPPITIEIEFLCPINLFYILLKTTVGTQKCTGIEIFAKNSLVPFTSICKAVYDKNGIIFCNSRKYSADKPPPNYNENHHLAFFKSNKFRIFLNTTAIRIVIFRTERSVPCLGGIEVWATTSKFCPPVTVQTIERIMNRTVSEPQSSKVDDEFLIPDDFKDDLVCELMTIPMTLPCGKTIDQTTLDKHIENEAIYGRKPCDPFTGIKFTEKCKPVLNVALKSRIDMFLLKHSNKPQTFGLKRMLGGRINNERETKRIKMDNETANDLDAAIEKAKSQLNYISFVNHDDEKIVCGICQNVQDFYYEIPCKHLYCRNCLLGICTELKCSVCNRKFQKSDVTKVNY